MTAAVTAACGLLGLLCGSFANVVIHRVPEGGSVLRPPSACPACGTAIRPRDNVPVLSWLVLRGRCRSCQAAIPARYPLVEVAGAAVFATVGWWIATRPEPGWWALPAYLLFGWMLLVVAVIDARTRRIPNALTYPLTPALAVLLAVAAVGSGQPGALLRGLLAGLLAFAVLLGLALISPQGMGMGDVKFAAFLGLGLGYLSWAHVVVGLLGAFFIGGIVSVALLALRTRGRKDLIPFGPYLCASAFAALLAGQSVADAYLRLSGLA